ncbi:M24 family metallopeptidase [Oceanobacillus neutriphilus]|uniref:Xaa-Pro aminopeptidase n=1 Tax=Oceanobacillus neutriphilus TaxID=531815 RepID=A0ABQ2NP65_9BACI|nr:M24 family metallopeptidase [Oceanobacillus neutriphilus]GGP07795.1 Xaa-Pro aminopeptidase [Oceanobacillus neutriphilus]
MFNVNEASRERGILALKKREEIRDGWLDDRLDTILPEAMEKAGIPFWIVAAKEYNEDPVIHSLTPSGHDSSGRISIFVFVLNGSRVEKYLIGAPHPVLSKHYKFIWNRTKETQWECLKRLVEEKAPLQIGINQSEHIAVADGLTHSMYERLSSELGHEWSSKFVSAEHLVIHWFLKRSKDEMTAYPIIADLTNNLAKTAISNEVIYPGITTTTDVVDWIRQKVLDLGLKTSFYPTIDVQRKDSKIDRLFETIIMPGDIVHLDFGIEYLGLSTDTQQLAYVLKQGENKAPKGLEDAFNQALLMEDIVMDEMKPGKTGNEVFKASIAKAKENNLDAMLYSHPVGVHCHEAGPSIGMFDQQKEIPFRGELDIVEDSAYALEFNIRAHIPEWDHKTFIYLEQPIAVYKESADYLTPRQECFYLIR